MEIAMESEVIREVAEGLFRSVSKDLAAMGMPADAILASETSVTFRLNPEVHGKGFGGWRMRLTLIGPSVLDDEEEE